MKVEKQTLPAHHFEWVMNLASEQDRQDWEPVLREAPLFFHPSNPFFQNRGQVDLYKVNQVSSLRFRHPDCIWQGSAFQTFSLVFGSQAHEADLHLLFDRMEADARSEGAKQLVGPILGKTCYNYRLTTSELGVSRTIFDPPALPSFESFLLKRNYKKTIQYSTDVIADVSQLQKKAQQRLPNLLTHGLDARLMAPTEDVVRNLYGSLPDLINRIFKDNPYFTPLTHYDFESLYPLKLLLNLCSRTSFLIFDNDNDNRLIGFAFNFPDPQNSNRLLVKSFGVLPEVSGRGRIFVKALFHLIENCGSYREIAFCQMVEGNQVQRLTSKHASTSIKYSLFTHFF